MSVGHIVPGKEDKDVAVILSSKTQTEAELVGALEANGLKPEVEGAETVEAEKPAEGEKKPSELPDPKVEKTEEEGDKIAADQESDEEDKSQEKPQGETKGDGDKPKSKGGFQKRLGALTRQKALVEDQLELERGSKVALQKQLDEVNEKLAALQPKEPEKTSEPVRPKRPTLKDADFDQDKLDGMLDEYETKLDEYHATIADKKAEARVAAAEEKRTQEAREATVKAQETAFYERRDKSMKVYEDFDELAEALGDSQTITDRSNIVSDYISLKSKDPAHLIHFFMDDFVNNGGAEAAKIEKMDGYDQAYAIKEIEDRLIKEHKDKSKTAPKAAKDPDEAEEPKTPEVKPPAKREARTETPDDPIKPLGGGGTRTKGKSLDEQMQEAADNHDPKTFNKLFNQQKAEKDAARV